MHFETHCVCYATGSVPLEEQQHINMPELRRQFPFLIKDRFAGRAKRTVRSLRNPMLVNSFKAHLKSVCDLVLLEKPKLMMSSSSDTTARIWTTGGQYIGTLGSPVGWPLLSPNEPPGDEYEFRMPPDIKRVASSTTIKVFRAGIMEDAMAVLVQKARRRARELESEVRAGEALKVYGASLEEPILGHDTELPAQEEIRPMHKLDDSQLYVSVIGLLFTRH